MKLKTGWTHSQIPRQQHPRPPLPRDGRLCRHRQDPAGPRLLRRHAIPVDPEAYKKIDPKKLAEELEVDMCAVNSGRFWMMDELEVRRRRHAVASMVSICSGAAT